MSESTPRHGLSLLVPGQGQKDITHNEALLHLDALLHPLVEEMGRQVPPSTPTVGHTWLVGDGSEGDWHGRSGELATWTAGGWRFAPTTEGLILVDRSTSARWRRTNEGWREELPRLATPVSIISPAGGGVVDAEARLALAALFNHLRALGFIL